MCRLNSYERRWPFPRSLILDICIYLGLHKVCRNGGQRGGGERIHSLGSSMAKVFAKVSSDGRRDDKGGSLLNFN